MNPFPLPIALLGGLLLAAACGPAQGAAAWPGEDDAAPAASADSAEARIVTEEAGGGMLRISGTFTGGGGLPDTLAYRLSVERADARGNASTSRQSGRFETKTGRANTLPTSMQVNVGAGTRLHVRLTILEGDRVVAEDELDKTYP